MTDKEKLEKIKSLADKMYTSMQYLTSDTRPIRKAMEEYHSFIVHEYHKEEPVSEDLEEAASRYAKEQYCRKTPATLPDRCRGCYAPIMYAFKAGANWQKEQLMAKAVDVTLAMPYQNSEGGYTQLVDSKKVLPFGDNLKVLVIKED